MADPTSQLEAFINELAAADQFSGAALVTKDGQVLLQQVHGQADKNFNIPNRLDTKFNLGSMNKMFTGVAVTQLAQANKLRFDDRVGQHLPDYPNREVAEKVTIHHLLTHTSGMGSYWNEEYIRGSKDRWRTVNDFLALFVRDPLNFAPGTRWEYSNAGFMLLGAIIEAVTGQDYFDYVRENIYQPAGMSSTDCYEIDRPVPNLAVGYTRMTMEAGGEPRRLDYWKNNLFMHVVRGGPAGGGYSTVEDLIAFSQALLGHRLLDAEHTETATRGKARTPRGEETFYGYGFLDTRLNGVRIVGHSGGFPGISSNLDMYVDLGYTLAVMSNYDSGAVYVSEKLRELLTS